ncbi:NADAR family protein [Taibaiella koreensis]|uniref:NADAR family protein n=1 Tax=Taibaiella koreensis TaxID=1268548 RepID=UPI000E59DE5D|nr:NADAR family protein [Taibaiella koreensis]
MEQYNKAWLVEQYRKQERLKFLFFWGHRPSKDGSVTASCFSQWWIAPFEAEGHRYPSAEHWMMAQKALLFNDAPMAEQIRKSASPAAAKKLGRQVQSFNTAIWDDHKFEIVRQGNVYKFTQHPELGQFLQDTGARVLVEASPVDPVWGIGMAADDPRAGNPLQWKGMNLLGFALMAVRDQI